MTGRLPRYCLSAAEVAARLGYASVDGFYQARLRLHAAGLPWPVPGRRSLVWVEAVIEAWLRDPWPPQPTPNTPAVPPDDDDLLEASRRAGRAAGISKRARGRHAV